MISLNEDVLANISSNLNWRGQNNLRVALKINASYEGPMQLQQDRALRSTFREEVLPILRKLNQNIYILMKQVLKTVSALDLRVESNLFPRNEGAMYNAESYLDWPETYYDIDDIIFIDGLHNYVEIYLGQVVDMMPDELAAYTDEIMIEIDDLEYEG